VKRYLFGAWSVALLAAPLLGSSSCVELDGIGPVGPIVKVCSGMTYAEGPAADSQGNLYFTDLRDPPGRIYRLDTSGRLDRIIPNSGRANGLALNADGEIVACQTTGRIVAYRPDGCGCRVLASNCCGCPFNAPNDLVLDQHGGVYFTDPWMGSGKPLRASLRQAVYYLAKDGAVTRLLDDRATPNGIGLSPDEKTLYVVRSQHPGVLAYPVQAPGCLGPGRVLVHLAHGPLQVYPGGDGMTVDCAGNLYIATPSGIQVFSSDGRALGILSVPERPSNVAFGGRQGTTLFITARHSVYALPMATRGVRSN
jgi:gluconolactonase